jgi:endonuclease/exonuclease/phosphatase family metal-dependent hydrolase
MRDVSRRVCLNIDGGIHQPALSDVLGRLGGADVFCFQEVFSSAAEELSVGAPWGGRVTTHEELQRALPDHQGLFFPAVAWSTSTWASAPGGHGLAIFVRRDLHVVSIHGALVHGDPEAFDPLVRGTLPRNLAAVVVAGADGPLGIATFHGLWTASKDDTPERLAQSRTVNELVAGWLPDRHILCGDLNLRPGTRSLALLAEGRRDLVHEVGIRGTRSRLCPSAERYADYVLVSGSIDVARFEALDEVCSDHLPLFVELRPCAFAR